MQVQVKLPSVLLHVAFVWHGSGWHSSISVRRVVCYEMDFECLFYHLTITSEAIVIEKKSFRTIAVKVTNGVDTDLITASIVYTTLKEICHTMSTILMFLSMNVDALLTHTCCMSWVWHKTSVTCYWVRILCNKCYSVHDSTWVIISVVVIEEHPYKICYCV